MLSYAFQSISCSKAYRLTWLLSEHGSSHSFSELCCTLFSWTLPFVLPWGLFLCCWCWWIMSANIFWTSAISLCVFCKAAIASERSTLQPFSFDCLSAKLTELLSESLSVLHLLNSVVLLRFSSISTAVWSGVSSGEEWSGMQLCSRAVCSVGHNTGSKPAFCMAEELLGGFHHRSYSSP